MAEEDSPKTDIEPQFFTSKSAEHKNQILQLLGGTAPNDDLYEQCESKFSLTREQTDEIYKYLKAQQKQAKKLLKEDLTSVSLQDVRIAVIGNVDSGKSTMIGVLTAGDLDDGRGSARKKILRHNHELACGRTSALSQHLLGFNDGKPIHNTVPNSAAPTKKTQAWQDVYSKSDRLITFVDLAGHEKYLRTTISGLTGSYPDYALIVVGANMGVSKMTKEHIQVAAALKVPLFVIVTKIDMAPDNVLQDTMKNLTKMVKKKAGKRCVRVKNEEEVNKCFDYDPSLEKKLCPVFQVSAVDGRGIDLLHYFLAQLRPRRSWEHKKKYVSGDLCEYEIDETFAVRGVGLVVSGVMTSGRLTDNDKSFLGPFSDGTFKEVLLKSIHQKRVPTGAAVAGDTASIAIRFLKRKELVDRSMIRKGMIITNVIPKPVWKFQAKAKVLHHPTTIKVGYQPVVHCGSLSRSVMITHIEGKDCLRSGDESVIDLQFIHRPEFIHAGRRIILREGLAKCIGKILKVYTGFEPTEQTAI